MKKLSFNQHAIGPVAQLGERTVRIREVRGFDPLQVHQRENHRSENWGDFSFDHRNSRRVSENFRAVGCRFGPPPYSLDMAIQPLRCVRDDWNVRLPVVFPSTAKEKKAT